MQLSLDGVNVVRKKLSGGRIVEYHYHRATGTRLPGAPGSQEYIKAYFAAQAQEPEGKTGKVNEASIEAWLKKYEEGPEYKRLARATQKSYQCFISAIRGRYGKMNITVLETKEFRGRVLSWRDEMISEGRPGQAYNLTKFLRTFANWIEERGGIEGHKLSKVKILYRSERAAIVWQPEQAFKACAEGEIQAATAICLALSTGQRLSDLAALSWNALDAEDLSLYPRKVKKENVYVGLPVLGQFKGFLAAIPRRGDKILTNSLGRSWESTNGIRNAVIRALEVAGFAGQDLHFHDMRGTVVNVLEDAGASEAQVAAITGHSLKGQAPTLAAYRKRTRARALAAMEMLDASWIGSLQTAVAKRLLSD